MPSSIERVEQRPGLPELILTHEAAHVRLALQGAHITEYAPAGHTNLLWVSKSTRFEVGAAIRGGIPLCWPWFGANLDLPGRPQHGFARTRLFNLTKQQADPRQASVILELDASSDYPEWDGAARLEVEIRLTDHLWMELRTTNLSDRELAVGLGLHNYFRVSDCQGVSIPALTGLDYRDKPEGFRLTTKAAPLKLDGEVDRVYLHAPDKIQLLDPERRQNMQVNAWGNTDLVVWNPGAAVARTMADFDDDGYRQMVCIEPALALDNRRRLAPGECFTAGQTIRLA